MAAQVLEATGDPVKVAFVAQDSTGEHAAQEAQTPHRRLEGVKLPEAKKGFVLLPKRWGVERRNA